MPVTIKEGNILEATENIIAHQVNGKGVMGAGLAKQIKKAYPTVYKTYKYFVKQHPTPESLLGLNLMVASNGKHLHQNDPADPNVKIISNLFGQADVGTSEKQTDEKALRKALEHLLEYAKIDNLSIAIPHGIGCGLGGGDWDEILAIIEDVFKEYPVTLYKYDK